MKAKRKLKMTIAGRFIDLLGHQMYGHRLITTSSYVLNSVIRGLSQS